MYNRLKMMGLLLLSVFIILMGVITGCKKDKKVETEPVREGPGFYYRIAEGKSLKYNYLVEFNQKMEVNGEWIGSEINRLYTFTITGTGSDKENYKLKITIDSVNLYINSPMGELEPDMSSLKGQNFSMVLSPLGKELETKGAEFIEYELGPAGKRSIAPDFSNLFPDLTGEDLDIGDTWESTDTIKISEGVSEIFIISNTVYTCAGFEVIGGLQCSKIDGIATGKLTGAGSEGESNLRYRGELNGTDTWYFAPEKGVLMKQTVNNSIEGTIEVSGAQEMTIPIKQKAEISIELVP